MGATLAAQVGAVVSQATGKLLVAFRSVPTLLTSRSPQIQEDLLRCPSTSTQEIGCMQSGEAGRTLRKDVFLPSKRLPRNAPF